MTSGLSKFITWAPGNYPAGSDPWSGQPMRVQPANAYVLPEATRPAETDNYVFGALADQAIQVRSYLGFMPFINMPYKASPVVTHGNVTAACFQGSNLFVASGLGNGTTSYATGYVSYDGGQTFSSAGLIGVGVLSAAYLAAATSSIIAVLQDPTGPSASIGNGDVFWYDGSWHTTSLAVGTAVATAAGAANNHLVWVGPPGSIVGTTNAIGMTMNPASMATAPGYLPMPVSAPGTIADIATAGIVVGATFSIYYPASCTGAVWPYTLKMPDVTSGGGGWTFSGAGQLPLTATTQAITAAAYNPATGAFLLLRDDSADSSSKPMRTYDGSTYTLLNDTSTGASFKGLFCIGGVFVLEYGGGSMLLSEDDGATWRPAPASFSDGTTLFAIAGANQTAFITGTTTRTSLIFNG